MAKNLEMVQTLEKKDLKVQCSQPWRIIFWKYQTIPDVCFLLA